MAFCNQCGAQIADGATTCAACSSGRPAVVVAPAGTGTGLADNVAGMLAYVTIIPAIRAILDSPDMRLDAFIGPGHVSTVIGCRPYEWVAANEHKPIVVSGFEPLDMLESIVMLLRQLREGRVEVENQYKRVVPWEGNRAALKAMAEVFQLRPYFEWRGMGFISQSALRLRDSFAEFDAEQRFHIPGVRVTDPKAAQCGEVLKGVLKPNQCKLFGKECTPENPVGALMVSSEGSCAAYYNYEHRKARWDGPPGLSVVSGG